MGSNRRRTVGPQDNELDSAGCVGEPARVKAKPVHKRELMYVVHVGQEVVRKTMCGNIMWLEAERQEGEAQ